MVGVQFKTKYVRDSKVLPLNINLGSMLESKDANGGLLGQRPQGCKMAATQTLET